MRIVFMGTPDFASVCLNRLIESGHQLAGVFTQPDKPVGRKQILTPPDVKKAAQRAGINVYQPKTLKNQNALDIIKSLQPDVIIVVAYGKILPKAILEYPRYGCINVHASLLPKYRGAAPIQWAVLNGDKETGVTVMQMDEGLDTGDMLNVIKTPIGEDETSEHLFERLSNIGADALLDVLESIDNIKPIPQPKGDYGYASMINKSMSKIDWAKNAAVIHNQIRGLQSWPCASTTLNSKTVKIHESKLTDIIMHKKPGTILCDGKSLLAVCGDGVCIKILELQFEGKKQMSAKSYLAGHSVEQDTVLGE